MGRTGLEVSAAGLGGGGFSRLGMFTKGIDNACKMIRYAYDHGVNFFDTASSYRTQPAFGAALEGLSRGSYIISSKFPYNAHDGGVKRAEELEKCLDQGLAELKTDYVDIYNLHGVTPQDYMQVRDRFYPELLKLKEKGKIRFIGITELFGSDNSHKSLKTALADDLWDMIMVGYNILNPSAAKTILPVAREKNVGVVCMFAVRSSLSNPAQLKKDIRKMLAARQADPALVKEDNTLDFLLERGFAGSIPEAAYRFCRHTDGISVTLTGTGSLDHLTDNIESLSMPKLPNEAAERLALMFGNVDCVSGQEDFPVM